MLLVANGDEENGNDALIVLLLLVVVVVVVVAPKCHLHTSTNDHKLPTKYNNVWISMCSTLNHVSHLRKINFNKYQQV